MAIIRLKLKPCYFQITHHLVLKIFLRFTLFAGFLNFLFHFVGIVQSLLQF